MTRGRACEPQRVRGPHLGLIDVLELAYHLQHALRHLLAIQERLRAGGVHACAHSSHTGADADPAPLVQTWRYCEARFTPRCAACASAGPQTHASPLTCTVGAAGAADPAMQRTAATATGRATAGTASTRGQATTATKRDRRATRAAMATYSTVIARANTQGHVGTGAGQNDKVGSPTSSGRESAHVGAAIR